MTSVLTSAPAIRLRLPQERSEAPSAYYGPTNFTWLVRGRLGGMPRPGLNHSFDADAEALRRIGVSMVVTLTEEWVPPVERFSEYDLKTLYIPIPDMEPPTIEQAQHCCHEVERALHEGHSVAFHCRAGRGRTGTMLAATLLWFEPDFDETIRRIKSTNRYWIESNSQMEFLDRFAVLRADGPESAQQRRRDPACREAALKGREKPPLGTLIGNPPAHTEMRSRTISETEGNDMSLDKALQSAMSTVPECLASGYVDMETGMLLGIQTIDSHPQEVLDTLAAATADLFQGSSVVFIEQIFKKARGSKADNHYFNEILVFSENLIHIFMRTKKYPDHVCCFICRKSANPGMALTKSRMSLEAVADAV